jgi:hypothetical protein
MTVLTKSFRLRGVHFLYDPNHNEPKHGHEYFLEVSVRAEVGRDRLQAVVEKEIVNVWDKQDWTKMDLQQASGELLVEEFDRRLRDSQIAKDLIAVALKETKKNRFVSARSIEW